MTKKKKDTSIPTPFQIWVLAERPTLHAIRQGMSGGIFESPEAAVENKLKRGFSVQHLKVFKVLLLVDSQPVPTSDYEPETTLQEVDVTLYTDGSVSVNPGGIGGWGVYASWQGEAGVQEEDLSGVEPAPSTNNRAELLAVINGLSFVRERFGTWKRIRIVTDSEYVLKGARDYIQAWKTYGWKTVAGDDVANKDLWMQVDELSNGQVVYFEWVKSHTGDPGNDRADRLAGGAWRKLPSIAS